MATKSVVIFLLSLFILVALSQGKGERYGDQCQARDDFLRFCGINSGSSLLPIRARPYCCQKVRSIQDHCLVGLSKREQFFINGATKICDNSWINVPPLPPAVSPPSEPPAHPPSPPQPNTHKICQSVTQLLDTCGGSEFEAPEDAGTYCCLQVRKITKHCYVSNLDPMERKLLLVAKNICDNRHAPLPPPPPQVLPPSPSPSTITPTPIPSPDVPTPSPDAPTPTPSPDVPTPVPSPSPSPDVPTPVPSPTPSPSPSSDVPTPAPSPDVPTPVPSPSPSPSPCIPIPAPSPDVPTPTPTPSPSPIPSPDVPTPGPSPDVPTPVPSPTPSPSPFIPTPPPAPDVPTPLPSPTPSPDVPTPVPSPDVPTPSPTPSPFIPTPAPTPSHRTRPTSCSIDTVLYDSCNPQKPSVSNASNSSSEEREFIPSTTSTGIMSDEAGCCIGFAIFTNDCRPAIKDLSYAKRNIYNSLEASCTFAR